jgi:rhomboid protease GluP
MLLKNLIRQEESFILTVKFDLRKMMQPQQRQSILCPNCRKLISAAEARCPHCGISRPGSGWKRVFSSGFLRGTDQFVAWIIYANVGMYLLSLLLRPSAIHITLSPFGMLSPSGESLFLLGATGTFPVFQYGRWWTLISANYLHGSLLHIVFNMLAFRFLASIVQEEYGTHRMFVLFTLGGLIGYVVSLFAGVRLTIGASASVCSLMGAVLYYGRSRGGMHGQALYKQMGGWALGMFLFGLLVPGINNWAHGGGILAGIGLGAFLGYSEKVRENLFHKVLGVGCMLISAAVLTWAVLSGLLFRLL